MLVPYGSVLPGDVVELWDEPYLVVGRPREDDYHVDVPVFSLVRGGRETLVYSYGADEFGCATVLWRAS